MEVHFRKENYADPNDPENQDRITDEIWITRGSNQGFYNAYTGLVGTGVTRDLRVLCGAGDLWKIIIMIGKIGEMPCIKVEMVLTMLLMESITVNLPSCPCTYRFKSLL